MALSLIPSSSSNTLQFKYHVFLSFRGDDTRYNFTSHLCKALRDKQSDTFIDHKLDRGDEISPSLLKAIEESQISIIIFSKGYASSRWCLEELVKILECKKRFGQIVIPVFYNVDPSDVRNQTGPFESVFTKTKDHYQESLEKVESWKVALTEAANLSGWDSSIIKYESVLIEKIVKYILKKLNDMSTSDDKDLVGIGSRIQKFVSLLGKEDVRCVGISGMGGIGKTTLAGAVFNKISSQFEGSYFCHDVREESEQSGGLHRLQRELHSAVLKGGKVSTRIGGRTFTRNRLGCEKLLIVFDDVTDFQQIEFLIGGIDCLSSQSRIIITSRDKQVLNSCRVDCIWEVEELSHSDALELFCRYAFKQNHPMVDYMELTKRVLLYARGLPLALKVLGSFLLDKREEVWESAISKLEKIPHMDIHKVLKISYDGLDDEVQKIFLDIACFFVGSEIGPVKVFLDACGFYSEIGISILIDKNLVTLSNNVIKMHDLLLALGREIERQESIKDPSKRSRLWQHEDIFHVLTRNTGTEIIEGISLDMSNVRDIYLDQHAFANMHKMRFLKFYCSSYEENNNKVHGFQALECDFAEIRYLNWYKCPLKSLPSRFHNLVTLEMHNSNIEQLWNGIQHLGRLKEVDLSFSEHLTSCADISSSPNLERLILRCCTNLCEIPSSIQYLTKLNYLNLTHCTRLTSLPDCCGLTSLKKLVLSYCTNLKMLSEMPCNIEELCLSGTAIEELPSSIENLSSLVILALDNCSQLESLPSSICKWKSLERLCLSGCSKVDKLPDDTGTLESLRHLRVERTRVREVLPPLLGWRSLQELDLTDCGITKVPNNLGCLSTLKILNLGKNNLGSIPASIINLTNLHSLDIKFRKLCLSSLDIEVVRGLDLRHILSLLSGSRYVRFTNCFKVDQNILKDIVEDALSKLPPRLQLLATLLKEEYCNKDFEDAPSTANVCYPGSEIPEWFECQTLGSFIQVKLRRDWLNDDFVGFALCAVVEFPNYKGYAEYNLHIICRYTTSQDVVSEFFVDTPYMDCPYKWSKHVIVGFDSRFFPRHISESLRRSDEVSFRFCLKDDSSKPWMKKSGVCLECDTVKKCGVRLMYKQRHQEKSDGSLCTGEGEDETYQDNGETRGRYFSTNGEDSSFEIQCHQWKIVLENGCELKVIFEDGCELKIDSQTGEVICHPQASLHTRELCRSIRPLIDSRYLVVQTAVIALLVNDSLEKTNEVTTSLSYVESLLTEMVESGRNELEDHEACALLYLALMDCKSMDFSVGSALEPLMSVLRELCERTGSDEPVGLSAVHLIHHNLRRHEIMSRTTVIL